MLSGIIAIVLLTLFLLCWWWAWLPSHKEDFQDAAQLPLQDEVAASAAEDQP